jgi:hypothetical protein
MQQANQLGEVTAMLRHWNVRMQTAHEHKQRLAHVKTLFGRMKLHGKHSQRVTIPAASSKPEEED